MKLQDLCDDLVPGQSVRRASWGPHQRLTYRHGTALFFDPHDEVWHIQGPVFDATSFKVTLLDSEADDWVLVDAPTVAVAKSCVTYMSAQQWQRTEELLKVGAVVEARWLRSATGMYSSSARQLMDAIERAGACAPRTLVVFHRGCAEHSVQETPRELRVPWRCPECEEVVEDADDLHYEVRLILTKNVRLV